tara:strand:+ start:865 stop:1011 length:147 start_codon:yes stop_codon:yes gene_type:complete
MSEVLRGKDLMESLSAKLAITSFLNQKPLNYIHVPLLLDSEGKKLSKR